MPPALAPGGSWITAAQDLALLLASDSVRGALGADERALLRGLRLRSCGDVLAASAAAAAGRNTLYGCHKLPATREELVLMRAVAAAAGRSPGPDTVAMFAAVKLWSAVRNGEELGYAGERAAGPAPPAPPAPPPTALPRAYGEEDESKAACSARAAAAARRALVSVRDAVSEAAATIVDVAATLAAMVAVGEGIRVRKLGVVLREWGAPVAPDFRLAVGELASLSRALLTVPSLVTRRAPPDDAEFYVRATLDNYLRRPELSRRGMEAGGLRYAALDAPFKSQKSAWVAAIHAGAAASDLAHAASAALRHGDEDGQGIEGESGEGGESLPDAVEDMLLMLVSASLVCCTTQDPAAPCPVVSAFAKVGAAGNASAWAGEAAARLPAPLRNGAAVIALACRMTSAFYRDSPGAGRALVEPGMLGALEGAMACCTLFATRFTRDGGGRGDGGGPAALCTLGLGLVCAARVPVRTKRPQRNRNDRQPAQRDIGVGPARGSLLRAPAGRAGARGAAPSRMARELARGGRAADIGAGRRLDGAGHAAGAARGAVVARVRAAQGGRQQREPGDGRVASGRRPALGCLVGRRRRSSGRRRRRWRPDERACHAVSRRCGAEFREQRARGRPGPAGDGRGGAQRCERARRQRCVRAGCGPPARS